MRSTCALAARSIAAAAVVAVAGCRLVEVERGEFSPAEGEPLAVVDRRVALEVFFVHLPPSDQDAEGAIWNRVDEQHFSPNVRRRLAEQAIRAGVVGSTLPAALEELLRTKGPRAAAAERVGDAADAGPLASRQELWLRPGRRGEIVVSPLRERLTVIGREGQELTGKTYDLAQGKLIVRCHPLKDGRVRLELTPQLQYGQPRRQLVGEDGVLRLETGQPTVVFDSLVMAPLLAPGQSLLIGCQDQPLSSLGRDFFLDTSGGKSLQRLLVIRLLQAPPPGAWDGSATL